MKKSKNEQCEVWFCNARAIANIKSKYAIIRFCLMGKNGSLYGKRLYSS